jgi:hypothetical protein
MRNQYVTARSRESESKNRNGKENTTSETSRKGQRQKAEPRHVDAHIRTHFFENRVSDLNIQNLAEDLAVSNDIRDPSLCSCSVFHLPLRCFVKTAQEGGVAKMNGGAKRLKRCTDWSDSDRRISNTK